MMLGTRTVGLCRGVSYQSAGGSKGFVKGRTSCAQTPHTVPFRPGRRGAGWNPGEEAPRPAQSTCWGPARVGAKDPVLPRLPHLDSFDSSVEKAETGRQCPIRPLRPPSPQPSQPSKRLKTPGGSPQRLCTRRVLGRSPPRQACPPGPGRSDGLTPTSI